MMIHEKIMSGQFLLDIKNEHSMAMHHHLPAHHGLSLASNAAASKLDLYSAYAYQQQLQQQLLIGGPAAAAAAAALHQQQQQQQALASPFGSQQTAEVLDLSRRCDSVETPRKTPSPYHSTSSFGGSPATSPTSNNATHTHHHQQQQQQQPQIPVNLLYSAQAAHQQLPPSLASLYPGLYYGAAGAAAAVKQEPQPSAVTTLSPATSPQHKALSAPAPTVAAASNLLQTFAASFNNASPEPSAAAVAPTTAETPRSPPQQQSVIPTTPTSSTAASSAATALAALDPKSTRPFKAFPRDPLVIAANFAATDVLLDNPRVERYTEYRKRVLEQIRCSNGGSRTVTNPKMRRTNSRSASVNEGSCSGSNQNSGGEESSDCDSNAGNFEKIMTTSGSSTDSGNNSTGNNTAANTTSSGSQQKDAAYYERRRKNNAAAKKSRDRRRIKEDEIAIRAAYLERQNIELLCQIDALKAQLAAFTASKVGA